jgi:hypothetical protein
MECTGAASILGKRVGVMNVSDTKPRLQSAVVNEGLRISYGVTTRLPRVAKEPIKYQDWVIPPNVNLLSPHNKGEVIADCARNPDPN